MSDNRKIKMQLLTKRWNIDPFIKNNYDHLIFKKTLTAIKIKNPSKYIACYWPIENEVDTIAIIDNLIKLEYKVCLPSINDNKMIFRPIDSIHFEYGFWKSMREPVTKSIVGINDIGLMLVPMIGYNKNNRRLGYGLNFYNAYLDTPNNIYTIGLAYQFQYNNDFITTNYDKILDTVITN